MSKSTTTGKTPSAGSNPIGVTILAAIVMALGLFSIVTGVTIDFILAGGDLTLVGSFQLGAIVVGVLAIIAGIGLWKLKSWAWWLAAIVIGIGLILNISVVFLDLTELRLYFLPMLLRALVLVYLTRPAIRGKFR
ncbi:MAG: hypothetical protein JSW61_07330 [Candidatus Thorarchaeota archaeon]|nr:MAG: hypothetical protein JSW61_07330 [Candidatus Thorarchaeota archaeon]